MRSQRQGALGTARELGATRGRARTAPPGTTPLRGVPSGTWPARPALVIAGVVLAVAVTGCTGGSDSAGGSGGSTTSIPTPTRSFTPPPVETATPSVSVTTLRPVPIGKPTSISSGVQVSIIKFRTLKVQAAAPGETTGPAVAFEVEVRNKSAKPVDLGGVVVNASYGKNVPAVPSSSPPNAPLTGSLEPGKTARGTYVFRVPPTGVKTVRIEVSSAFAAAVAIFAAGSA